MKADRLIVPGIIVTLLGAGVIVLGPSGVPLPVAALVPLSGIALVLVGIVIRRRTPASEPEPRTTVRSAGWRIGAVAGLVLLATTLALGTFLAVGEARGHVFFHALFGAVEVALFIALGLLWDRTPATATTRARRRAFLAVLWAAAAGALVEGIGGAGYDELNSGHRIGWLTTLHNAVTGLGALTLVVLPLALVVLAVAVVMRLRASTAVAP